MDSATRRIRVLPGVTERAKEDLRRILLYSYSTFSVYRRSMSGLGISRLDILHRDPLDLLRELPLLDGDAFHELTE